MSNFLKTSLNVLMRNLTLFYTAALLAIAILLIVGYLLVSATLVRQSSDSHVVNIAGRQRMLSQKISKHAVKMLQSAARDGKPFDVALLDYQMPEMDGFDLARTIKADAQLASVRIVLMPSFGSRGDGQTAREIGIAAYLMKPVRQSQLFDCLTTVMDETETFSPTATNKGNLITRHTLTENEFAANTRILIAEDNLVNQKVSKRQVEKLGYRADLVANGLEALDALANFPYDMVLMDCQMPEMDGYEAVAEIRRREGSTKHTVIIALTANAMEGEMEKCLAAGMDDYLTKPVNVKDLQNILERWRSALETRRETTPSHSGSFDQSSTAPVDLSRLRDAAGDDDELLRELIEIYLQQTSENLEKLKAADGSGATDEAKRLAHLILGSSVTCGMTSIAASLRELE